MSVLMTSYNREKYIHQAIESVLASTYRNLELVIVDDLSTDQTVEIARTYAMKDARVKIFLNEKNLGDYPNRNQAARHATGKYLKYVDADDYIYPWALEQMVSSMEKFPKAGWGLCSMEQDLARPFPFMLSPAEAYKYQYMGPGLFHRAPLSSIIRKDVFEQVGGFSPMRMVGDFEMWHRLAQRSPVVLMPQGMVWYRLHAEQELKSYRSFVEVYEQITLQYLLDERCPLDKHEVEAALTSLKKIQRREILKGITTFRIGRIVDGLKRLRQHRKSGKTGMDPDGGSGTRRLAN